MNTYVAEKSTVATTLALCFAIALLEGLDLQSVGVAAPRMAREFGLTVSQMGIAFSAGTFGLLPGAMLGGRLADRIGRKRVLIASVVLFGLLSIATAQVSTFAMLVVVRVLTGIGLGGAMPNLIALSSEAVEPRSRSSAVATMYCGIPFGGVIASLIGVLLAGDTEWRHIFYVGGLGPLLLVPLLVWCLPESRAYLDVAGTQAARASVARTLFGDGRTTSTLALWVSYFCTLIVLYFLLNWLPSLMAARGLDRAHVGLVQIAFNVGAGLGALGIGAALDRMRASRVVGGMYVGIVLSLAALAAAPGFASLAAAAFAAGMFVVGGQSVLYALAAMYYPTAMRGTGVGSAVAVGRLGSVVGPLAAATLLAAGRSAPVVIGASIPVTLVAAVAALLLIRRPRAGD
ncbi:3-(3-hydroxy-phenyl)propionate transporter MhpT [Burkholderia cenocepacia]|jgi:MFS transporter, AAHS family, 3-hydroxyphenylpropionic acid transporter|uniref:3-(3-hydroxy-phenyl)propionate transporter MhpT n=1 Tax=Burkholderia cenocepacia TaxID=95486 RepID=UPI00078C92E9|nr:3-(3-hydroxy-phenyl)propionate transporter MhpT [Burkholderia cenocepacia]AMU12478.1 3-(3-hydroxy-phenyl)propionate transporter MhpT [Burkholderia cenocepacia]MCW3586661.1 3-(3-hydroxy-phenyl)propionate transporter MhpT [Burkholderia cenocepacia]MCW3631653.1 3-(3-hydroxy-phenyl)propionate transporter MhpT [Burkholderia cenocepacia]MCW3645964.1 3-(3-hydroxy-phenyl)propionate transporter MhpT [Burkholderia cenocepacia]MCW5180020.1 3-(3-hydroxy-phenyl)propionate transporter MhpT [Burkholderia 